jgi:hypothetical protein
MFEFLNLSFELVDAVALETWRCWNALQVVARASLASLSRGCTYIALDFQAMTFFASAIPFSHVASKLSSTCSGQEVTATVASTLRFLRNA